jgi:hypothetical protein
VSDRVAGKVRRVRRSWYRRRLRIQRGLAVAALIVVIAFVVWQNAARFFPLPAIHGSQLLPDSFSTRANLRQELAWTPAHAGKHVKRIERDYGVYPYSVVPGGLKDGQALREAAKRDRAVFRHFAHFDYDKAHLVRVTEPREVYVSYRIRDTVFWTRKKVRLHAGELLLTDGKITARAKCGNQVSDTAKPEISNEEPEEDVLDQPVALEPIGPSMAVHPVLGPPELPTGQPIAPQLYANGFMFPYLNSNVPAPPSKTCQMENGEIEKRCRPHRKPAVPEPSTMILIASGLAVVLRRYQASRRPLAA